MVTDKQVRRLRMLIKTQKTMAIASAKAGMDEKTARRYLKNGQLPSQCKSEHTWCTRSDPFDQEWEEIKEKLDVNPGLEAKTLFEALQREKPGKFSDGQLRFSSIVVVLIATSILGPVLLRALWKLETKRQQ